MTEKPIKLTLEIPFRILGGNNLTENLSSVEISFRFPGGGGGEFSKLEANRLAKTIKTLVSFKFCYLDKDLELEKHCKIAVKCSHR